MVIDNEDVRNFINTALEFYSRQVIRENYSINDAKNLNIFFKMTLEKKFKNHDGKEKILEILEELYKLNTSENILKLYKSKNNKECVDIMIELLSIKEDKDNIKVENDEILNVKSSFDIIISTYLNDLKRTSDTSQRAEYLEQLVTELKLQYNSQKVNMSDIMDCLNKEFEVNLSKRVDLEDNTYEKRIHIMPKINDKKKKEKTKVLEINDYMTKADKKRIDKILESEENENDFLNSLKVDSLNLEDEKHIDGSYIFENDKGEEVLIKRIRKYEYTSKKGDKKVLEKFIFKYIDKERFIQSAELYAGFDIDKFKNTKYADFCISKMFDSKYMMSMFICNKAYLGEVKDFGENNFEFSKKSPEQKRKINSLEIEIFMEQINKRLESLKR